MSEGSLFDDVLKGSKHRLTLFKVDEIKALEERVEEKDEAAAFHFIKMEKINED